MVSSGYFSCHRGQLWVERLLQKIESPEGLRSREFGSNITTTNPLVLSFCFPTGDSFPASSIIISLRFRSFLLSSGRQSCNHLDLSLIGNAVTKQKNRNPTQEVNKVSTERNVLSEKSIYSMINLETQKNYTYLKVVLPQTPYLFPLDQEMTRNFFFWTGFFFLLGI